MEHSLEAEQFKLVEKLVEIQDSITTARNALSSAKAETEEYLKAREQAAVDRVSKVLTDSVNALEETKANHEELTAFGRELSDYSNFLKEVAINVTVMKNAFSARMSEAERIFDEKHLQVQEVLKNVKIESVQVAEDRKQLAREKYQINEDTRLLADRRGALERGFDELKRLQNK